MSEPIGYYRKGNDLINLKHIVSISEHVDSIQQKCFAVHMIDKSTYSFQEDELAELVEKINQFSVTTIDELLDPIIQHSVIRPREVGMINHDAFSAREIRRIIGDYTTSDVGERSILPERVLHESKHNAFTDKNNKRI